MVVKLLVVVRLHVATREQRLDVLQEFAVDRHHVLDLAVFGTFLDHPHLAVALNDRRLDLADLLIDQRRHIALTRQYLLTRLDDALRAKRIRLPRETERRLRLLPRFKDRLVSPLRGKRRVRLELIHRLDRVERARGDVGQTLLDVLDRSLHRELSSQWLCQLWRL